MEIKIQARNIDLNLNAEQYIQKKFDRLERHLPNLDDAKMEVSMTQAPSYSRSRPSADDAAHLRLHPTGAGQWSEPVRCR